ncbi:MAG: ABC transporter substrate binding protein, partial [Pseudolabrys sp.]
TGLDPVAVGLVGTLSRPEANVTGITSLNVTVGPKGLELLHELVPKAKSLAVLVNPSNPVNTDIALKNLGEPAHARGLQLHVLNASSERDFDSAFAKLVELQVGGLVIATRRRSNRVKGDVRYWHKADIGHGFVTWKAD